MKYKAYPEYKDSGVEWLGVMPYEWSRARLKFIANVNMGQSPNSEDCNLDGNGIAFLQGNAEFGKISPKEKQYCLVPKKIAKSGELLFSVRAPVGALNIADKEYGIGRGLCSIRGLKDIKSTYLWWVLLCYKYQLDAIATGSTFEAVSVEQVENLCLTLPSVLEQSQIASFLDNEISKIDQLIFKQEKLIELLKEKRQAVISHAVTKGLNPDVKMKDSGVEWLGDVPEHWIVKPLRHIGSCQNGINIGAEYFGRGYPFVSYGDVYNNNPLPQEVKGLVESSIKDRNAYSVIHGDIFFTRTSETIEEIGFASTCISSIPNAAFAGFLIRFRPFVGVIIPEYSRFYFSCVLLRAFFIKEMNLVTRASLSQELLKMLPVVLPPLEEQNEIASFLEGQTNLFDKLVKNVTSAISLLKERRSALISAVVTGKIDVRDWKPKDTA